MLGKTSRQHNNSKFDAWQFEVYSPKCISYNFIVTNLGTVKVELCINLAFYFR